MAYSKYTWVNKESELSAENFNHIEDGVENAYPVQLIAVSSTAPTSCTTGDKYYNTSSKLVFTAIATDTWGDTGETPISDVAYWVLSDNGNYGWDGTDLVSIGGGKAEVIVSDTQPTEGKLWVDTAELSNLGSEVVNTLDGGETDKAPSVALINEKLEEIDEEIENSEPVVLYNSENGETGDITLSDSAANYTYLEIYYAKDNGWSYTKIYSPNGKIITLHGVNAYSSTAIQETFKNISIKDTIIKSNYGLAKNCDTSSNSIAFVENNVLIYRVVGIK